MKIIVILASFIAFSFIAMTSLAARTTYVRGSGSDTSFCSYNGGSFCMDGIKRNAEREAESRAEQSCRLSQGQPLSFSKYFSSSCSPSFLGPNDTNVYVRCSSECNMQCQID